MNIAHKAFHALFSPPRSIAQPEAEDHNRNSTKPAAAPSAPAPSKPNSEHRCEFAFSDGRQCRSQRAHFCAHHASKPPIRSGSASRPQAKVYPQDELSPVNKVNVSEGTLLDLADSPELPELQTLCSDLTTATSINRALAQTFLLMAQGRLSRKDAVAFGYLSQLLLQTVSGVRAEYVSAFGYRQWEQNLKTSLAPDADEDPDTSPSDPGPSGLGNENDEQPVNGVVEPEKALRRERHGDQELRGAKEVPDYESLLSRSRDMLDRKYDVTPEGRREANALALELELMKPPDSKPPKGHFGRVVDLVRRLQAANSPIRSGSASRANSVSEGPLPSSGPTHSDHLRLNSLGHPIKPTSEYPREWFEPKPNPASAKSSAAEPSASPAPFSAESPRAPAAPPASPVAAPASPAAQPPAVSSNPPPSPRPENHFVAPPEGHPRARDFVAPPSRRPEPGWPSTGADGFPGPGPHADPFPPDPLNRTGHTTDWYAPASWSGRRQPDPFPSRKEKLARKLRGMSDYRFRRLQHLHQAKVFWG